MYALGPDFRQEHTLADGVRVVLRHIRADDAAELRRGFERLSSASRYRRFLSPARTLTDEQVRYFTSVDGIDHVAIVATSADDGSGLGVARFVRLAGDPEAAEVAITVADGAQGKGLGSLLAVTLARAAMERGIRRFRGEVLAGNEVVRRLLEEVGARIRSANGALAFEVDLESAAGADVVARRLLRAAATAQAARPADGAR
jgi:RimJ/RimL family protein N-acetyltransferase